MEQKEKNIVLVVGLIALVVIVVLVIFVIYLGVKKSNNSVCAFWTSPSTALLNVVDFNSANAGDSYGPILLSYSQGLDQLWTVDSSLNLSAISVNSPSPNQYFQIISMGQHTTGSTIWYPFVIAQYNNNQNQLDVQNPSSGVYTLVFQNFPTSSGTWLSVDSSGCGSLILNTTFSLPTNLLIGPGFTGALQPSSGCSGIASVFIGILPNSVYTPA